MIKTYFKVALLAVLAVGAIMVISCEKKEKQSCEVINSNHKAEIKDELYTSVGSKNSFSNKIENLPLLFC